MINNTELNKRRKRIKPFEGFFEFIKSHGVISLAIGLFLGVSLKTVVDAIVTNIVNPIVGVLSGNINLNNSFICLKSVHGACTSKLGYGAVASSVIEFLIAAFVVYFIIKILRLDRIEEKSK
jgi:large conductance mechanosensitive channel